MQNLILINFVSIASIFGTFFYFYDLSQQFLGAPRRGAVARVAGTEAAVRAVAMAAEVMVAVTVAAVTVAAVTAAVTAGGCRGVR